jgi:uncharacterized protein YceK
MRKIILAILLFSMSGCASYQQALSGYESAALVSIKAANDNILNVSITAICGTPYSALIRHPELWDVMPKLCAGGAKEATPESILKDTK